MSVEFKQAVQQAINKAGSRNRLCGLLDISTQGFEQSRRSGNFSNKIALRLSKLTGQSWEVFAPVEARSMKTDMDQAIEQAGTVNASK